MSFTCLSLFFIILKQNLYVNISAILHLNSSSFRNNFNFTQYILRHTIRLPRQAFSFNKFDTIRRIFLYFSIFVLEFIDIKR